MNKFTISIIFHQTDTQTKQPSSLINEINQFPHHNLKRFIKVKEFPNLMICMMKIKANFISQSTP